MDIERISGVAKPGPTRALARASAHLALASGIGDQFIFITANGMTGPTISLCGPTISISTYHVNSTLYKTIDWLSMAGHSLTGHKDCRYKRQQKYFWLIIVTS